MFKTTFDEKAKLWSGIERPQLYNPNINIAHAILRSMKLFGSKIAQVCTNINGCKKFQSILCSQFRFFSQINVDTGVRLTFNEIRTKTIRAAQHLQNCGYKPKQVFGLMVENMDDLAPIVFAAYSLGCPINALSTTVDKPDVLRMLGITQPSVFFCDVKVYDLIKECLTELRNDAQIYTFNGTKNDSIAVETLFAPTGAEDLFV